MPTESDVPAKFVVITEGDDVLIVRLGARPRGGDGQVVARVVLAYDPLAAAGWMASALTAAAVSSMSALNAVA